MKRIALVSALVMLTTTGCRFWVSPRPIPPVPAPSIEASPQPTVAPGSNTTGLPLKLPPGFSISMFAKDLGKPRVLTVDPAGTLLVSIPASGKVVALPDQNGDGRAEAAVTVIAGLRQPHGLAWRCFPTAAVFPPTANCKLYIAETHRVAAYDYDPATRKATNARAIADLPGGGNHFTRTLLALPAADPGNFKAWRLLVSVGSSCNVCREVDPRRAKILVTDYDGGELAIFASGLRNAVFLARHPFTNDVWVTEMGRDWLGDDLPPDEINIVREGGNYGWPICYGKNVHDTDFDKSIYKRNPCQAPTETPSHLDLPAHVAPLGLSFIPEEAPHQTASPVDGTGQGWPKEYHGNLLVAFHGSWNRTRPTGYKIVRYPLDTQGNPTGPAEDFITGWLQPDGTVLGRPVDILTLPGGVAYVSDDKAGVVYRLTYDGTSPPAPPQGKPCRPTGCSGQVCADEDIVTTCEFRPEYACYKSARCERQPNGQCGFTPTPELTRCLEDAKVEPTIE